MNTKKKLPFAFLALTVLASCHSTRESAESSDEVKAVIPVQSATVQQKSITVYQTLNGVTQFQKRDNIRSNCTGYIESLNYRVGDNIQKGNLFCTIKTKEQSALSGVNSKDTTVSRFSKPLSIYSNSTGSIASIAFVQGDYVAEGDVLATVLEPNSLVVQVFVPFEYRSSFQSGKVCEILLPDGKSIKRTTTGELPTVEVVSQSQSFYIRIPDLALPENLNVAIRFPIQSVDHAICVPIDAVQTDEQQKEFWVMKVLKNTLAVKVPIELGLRNDSIAEISSDKLHINDIVVTKGSYQLADSSIVKIQKGE